MAGDNTRQHDQVAEWVREHARFVRGYLVCLVRRRDVADDLLQEVFRRAWESRRSYIDQGRPRAYLLRIADRLACDWARRCKREQPLNEADWQTVPAKCREDEPLDQIIHQENRRQLEQALDMLSDAQRRTLLLRYYGDLEYQQIAQIMECSTNTALSHARRALIALRRLMVEESET